MTRTTGVLTDLLRLADSWIEAPLGPTVSINAGLGRHVRLRLTQSCTLEPPYGAHPGQMILLKIEQDVVGGWTLTPNTVINTRGTRILNTTALAVTVWMLLYNDDTKLWDIVGVPDLSSTYLTPAAAAATYLTITSAASTYQPLNTTNLTPIANLTTTSYGRALLELADQAALKTATGQGSIATKLIIAAQSDFVGADLAALKVELNGLLAKMRTSGALAT